jgi:hypothetical protein
MNNTASFSHGARRLALGGALALAALLCATQGALAQIKPPPLPPGSAMVRIESGMDSGESARQLRAHHHKFHYGKDYTRDETMYGEPHDELLITSSPLAMVTPQLATQRAAATAARPAAALAPCPPVAPGREPTAGELAARKPRAGDVASGAAAAPVALQPACTPVAASAATPISNPLSTARVTVSPGSSK